MQNIFRGRGKFDKDLIMNKAEGQSRNHSIYYCRPTLFRKYFLLRNYAPYRGPWIDGIKCGQTIKVWSIFCRG